MQWAKNDLHIFASLLCKVLLCAQLIKLWVSGIEVKVRRCVEVRTNKAMREFVWSVAAGRLHSACSGNITAVSRLEFCTNPVLI